jgi:hypothetical protein
MCGQTPFGLSQSQRSPPTSLLYRNTHATAPTALRGFPLLSHLFSWTWLLSQAGLLCWHTVFVFHLFHVQPRCPARKPYSQLHGIGMRRTQGAAAPRRKTHVSVEMRVFLSLRKILLPLPNHERRRRTTDRFTSARFFPLPKIRAAPSSQCDQTPRNPPYSGVCIDRKKGNIAITMNSRVNIASCIVVVSTFVRVEIHRHLHYRVSLTRSPSHQSPWAYHLSCRERRPNRSLIV